MKIFLYSGTHWDREWYQTFQGFRHRLVEMTDLMLDGLDRRDDYGVFHFDGQTIVLEDILEIAPDLEPRLAKYIKDGRIVIGPWYCMPDEFIISGESLIRNLQIGREICHRWGVEPSCEGYICDIFGHIAQMPQIFDGMNIHHAVLGRGTNEHNVPMHFRWRSPDGTDVRTFKLKDAKGYSDFTEVGARTTGPAEGVPEEEIVKRIREYVTARADEANIPVVMYLDALDHNNWHADSPTYVKALQKVFPDAEVYHTDIAEFCRAVDEYKDQLPFRDGELNETTKLPGGYAHLITNVLSSRYPIKKANDIIQTRLEKIVQPLYACGMSRSRDGFLKLAQKYLIQNHPHDSICGCSIDQVHRDMMHRFDQSRLILDEIMSRVEYSLRDGSFAAPVKIADDSRPARILRIYNPLPYRMKKMIRCDLRLPKNWNKYSEPFGYEDVCAFKLYTADGTEVPYGIRDITTYGHEDVYTIHIETELLPSGYTDLEVRPSDKPTRYLEKLSGTAYTAENQWLILTVNESNGTVSLTDKETGYTADNLLTLMDNGEIGDGWFHCSPKIDRIVTQTVVSVEKCENSINAATFRIHVNLRLPVEIDRHNFGTRRAEETVDCPVIHEVTLYRTEKYVQVKTIVDNRAKDHRLKLRLPTGILGDSYKASQAFALVERKTGSDPDTADWKETAVAEKATEGVVVKANGEAGLAFISKYGLHECAVYENGDMDITLLRCYRKTVGTNGEPDGQLIGTHEFEYLIAPVKKADSGLIRLEDAFRTDVVTVTAEDVTGKTYPVGLELPENSFIFSTANKLADGMEFRLWNCSDDTETGEITLPEGYTKASLTHIDGRLIEELPVTDGKIRLTLTKWKIATVKLTK
ncbi:MAG: hypothetical protein IJF78_12990 [Clostridia bacterium]|nr:hypothetical protein [Clostridia bacterium]